MSNGEGTFVDKTKPVKGSQRKSKYDKLVDLMPARTRDNFMLLLLLVMGLTGFAYILSTPIGNKPNRSSLFNKIFNKQSGSALTSDYIKSNFLHIEGELKANMPIVFNFTDLSQDCSYKFNYGDQHQTLINSNSLTHTYPEAGSYKVEMIKIKSGESFVIHCENINIQ